MTKHWTLPALTGLIPGNSSSNGSSRNVSYIGQNKITVVMLLNGLPQPPSEELPNERYCSMVNTKHEGDDTSHRSGIPTLHPATNSGRFLADSVVCNMC